MHRSTGLRAKRTCCAIVGVEVVVVVVIAIATAASPLRAGVIVPGIELIPPLPSGINVFPKDVNAAGVVVGVAEVNQVVGPTTFGNNHAFRYQNGVTTDIAPMPPGVESFAGGINNAGVIVGSRDIQSTRWVNNVALPLIGLNDAGRITESGIVSGSVIVSGRVHAARLFTPGGFIQDMMSASTGTDYYARDINNAGVIIGWYQSSSSSGGVFRVGPNPNQFTIIASPVGYNADNLQAINDRGVVVGSMIHETRFREHAFRNRNGITDDLGTLPGDSYSFAYDINNDGAIVGTSYDSIGTRRAVAWREDGAIIDLEAWLNQNNPAAGAKWTLLDATSISSNGYVVGFGQYEGVYQHYLLDATGFLPEPAGVLPLLALATVRFASRGRRRRFASRIGDRRVQHLAADAGIS